MLLSDEFLEREAKHWFDYLKRKTGTIKDTMNILELAFNKLAEQTGKVTMPTETTASIYLRLTINSFLTNFFLLKQ